MPVEMTVSGILQKKITEQPGRNSVRKDIDLAFFEKRLKERLAEITVGLDAGKGNTAPKGLDQSRVGRLSRMDAMQQQAMAKAAARLAVMEKDRIQKAMDRMKSGDYGYCTSCEEEIMEKRLRFDPSIQLCIECARAAEDAG